jgi:hypothetical protein
VPIDKLRLREGSRFIYEYDLNVDWHHEIRIEDWLEPDPRKTYPVCLDGHGACPPEDWGGPAGYFQQRDAVLSLDAVDDLDAIADFVEEVVLERRPEVLLDAKRLWQTELALSRTAARGRWRGRPFSRREVNARFRRREHHTLMYQQQ